MKKVLITGMSGLIGGLLRRRLESVGGYELTALNRRPLEGVRCFQADIADLEAIKPAFQGQDVVVHLAAYLGGQDFEGQLRGNVVGAYNVYEAARQAGVKRVVFASSGNAIRGFELVPPYSHIAAGEYDKVPPDFPKITHEMVRPSEIYGAAKVWGEALGRHFSDAHGLSALCVRIGSVSRQNRPRSTREFAIYLSHDDVASFLHSCIEAPDDLKYDIFMATSNNRWSYRDLSHAKDVLGWEPKDSADVFR
ncbi:MAG: NAD(P)-dependent oxidoreductase [Chloroflexi bacterium]|nr:NAD(P)-dependent oxidoreductase [Chloroflexota bacterium]